MKMAQKLLSYLLYLVAISVVHEETTHRNNCNKDDDICSCYTRKYKLTLVDVQNKHWDRNLSEDSLQSSVTC